ncbi:MAG: FAD-dependent oxidoreductase, partial [Pseudomonadota bacterium]
LAEYLARENYSDAFAEGFVYPAFAGICTCSRESVKSYPARVILEYLNSNLLLSSVQRVVDGTQEVVERLAANVRKRQLGVDVTGITRASNHAIVHVNDNEFPFDHVIIATQANQALDLLNESASKERAVLESFKYESSRVVVHSDPALAPASGPKHWAPVNFLMANKQSTPMATIWLNAIQNIGSDEPIFQTWNPIVEPRAEHVIGESTFERPVVNEESLAALSKLNALHDQPDRRVWFVGSYASHGIPLLESATTSAMRVAAHLGCQPSWQSDSSPIMLDGLSVSRASG